MRNRITLSTLGVALTAIALTGCSVQPSASPVSAGASETGTITYHAEYPSYDSLEALEDTADIVAEVALTGESRTYELTPVAPEDPTDPEQNPEYGAPAAPAGEAPTTPPIIVTAFSATVVSVEKGDVSVGDVIEVKQLGGESDGTSFVAEHESSLGDITSALVFLSGDGADPYSLLNPSQAQYPEESDGDFAPLPENDIAVTAEEVTAFVAE